MFASRPRTLLSLRHCNALAVPLLSIGLLFYQAATPAVAVGAEAASWQPASRSASTQPHTAPSGWSPSRPAAADGPTANAAPATAARWVLPTGSSAAAGDTEQAADQQASREPRAFVAPSNVAPLAPRLGPVPPQTQISSTAGQRAASNAQSTSASNPRPGHSAPQNAARTPAATGHRQGVTQASASMSGHNEAIGHPRRAAASGQAAGRRAPQAAKSPSYATRLSRAMNVAFEGPETWTGDQEEDLPLPNHSHGPVIHESGPEFYDPGYGEYSYGGCSDGMCTPYGEPGCGCADIGCGDGICGCGEPTCGCASGPNDLFCLGYGDDESCHTIRVRLPRWQEFMVFGGVHGFKGPYDQERDSGNFGFHEGLNVGFKIPFTTMGYQLGYQAVHSQLHGDKDTDIASAHTQHFFTAALYQRSFNGLQCGVAYDMLRDERWGSVDFHQLRGELSYVDCGCHEFGLAATVHLNQHESGPFDSVSQSTLFQASDQYLLFYRYHGKRGGEGRVFGGFNDDDDGILGADMLLPVHDRWSVQTGFTYLIPSDDAGELGASQEAWNIGINLVWHWDFRARSCHKNPYRPLFNVADNGSLIVDDRPGP